MAGLWSLLLVDLMPDHLIQSSFNSGEWSPKLFARVDLAKYRSGAALLENFFVDYRGGASTRPGTKYVLQCFKAGTSTVRLITFQASFAVGYVLELGDQYIRFYSNGAPILESAIAITGITNVGGQANLQVVNTYTVGDWLFIHGVAGAIQLNGNYYIISARDANNIRLTDLFGNVITFASLSPWTAGGGVARVYTISSPYLASEVNGIKFAQNVGQMILCHPNHVPYSLVINSPASWTLAAITFGTTAATPAAPTLNATS